MKNIVFVFAITMVIFSLSSCKPSTTTTTVVTKATMTEPGTNGFLISQEIVVKGNTVWGFSEKAYGTGFQWRDIVAQNPFLQQPGRVYYNEAKKMWIVKIYPGEVVRIGGNIVAPSCVYEETTTTIEKTSSPDPIIPWWLVWTLVAALVLAFIIWLFTNNRGGASSSAKAIDVEMNGLKIDSATKMAQINNEHLLWMRREDAKNNLIKVIQTASDKDMLKHVHFNLEQENFSGTIDYRDWATVYPKQQDKKIEEK